MRKPRPRRSPVRRRVRRMVDLLPRGLLFDDHDEVDSNADMTTGGPRST